MELGKLTAVFDADTRKFDSGIRGVATKVNVLKGTFGELTGGVSSATGALSGLVSPMALAAGGAVLAASAVGGLAVGLFNLVKSSAEAGGELFDLSQKTNFTVETLSGLSIVAKTTGSDIKSLSASLGIFQKNMEAAADPTSKQGALFKSLNIDIHDNEKALRQAFTQLNKLGTGAHQTAVAMQLFGRSGKDVLGIIAETNGNLDEAIKKYDKMGLIISSSAATASDKFNDVLEETTLQLAAVTRAIGMELLPVATETLQEISFALAANKGQWKAWGESVADVVRGTKSVLTSEIGKMIGELSSLGIWLTGVGVLVKGLGAIGKSERPGEDFFGPGGAGRGGRGSLPGTPEWEAAQKRLAGLEGGPGVKRAGGGGGGSTAQKDTLESLKNEVISLNTEFRKLDVELFNSANMTELAAEKEKILSAVMGQLSEKNKMAVSQLKDVDEAIDAAIGKLPAKSQAAAQALREQAIAQFKSNEQTRIAGELTKATEQLAKEWRQEIENTRTGADAYTIAIQGLEKEYRKYGQTLSAATRAELENAAAMQKTLALTRERLTITAQTRPRFAIEDVDRDAINAERPRIATVEEQVTRERIQMIRDEMKQLGSEVMSIFSESIHRGFEGGIKSGLASLAQGLLQIVENIFLRKLEAGLSDLLGNIATGSGGLGGVLRSIIPGLPSAAPATGTNRHQTVTPRDVVNQTHELTHVTTQQTQALSNQIQLTGQQIVQGLTPARQGFWEGLLGAAISGAVSGLASGLTSGLTSGGGDSGATGNVTSTASDPSTGEVLPGGGGTRPRRVGSGGAGAGGFFAEGGYLKPGQWGIAGERGPEPIYGGQTGMTVIPNQAMGQQTVNNITIMLPPTPPGSYKSPQSQRQLAAQVLSALQGAKR